jgi:hypothetical protein
VTHFANHHLTPQSETQPKLTLSTTVGIDADNLPCVALATRSPAMAGQETILKHIHALAGRFSPLPRADTMAMRPAYFLKNRFPKYQSLRKQPYSNADSDHPRCSMFYGLPSIKSLHRMDFGLQSIPGTFILALACDSALGLGLTSKFLEMRIAISSALANSSLL